MFVEAAATKRTRPLAHVEVLALFLTESIKHDVVNTIYFTVLSLLPKVTLVSINKL